MRVVLLGRKPEVMAQLVSSLNETNVNFITGTSLQELQATFEVDAPSAVIMGAGLPLELRLEVIRFVFEHSKSTTVHLKDWASGPTGMLPFVQGVVKGIVGRESINE